MEIPSSENEIEVMGDGRRLVPSQATKGKARTAVVGGEAEHRGCPGSRKWTVTRRRAQAAQLLHMMAGIAAEIGCAGDAKAATAWPKKGTEIPESRPACRAECPSTELRKRGKRGTERKGRAQTCTRRTRRTRRTRFADPAAHSPACRQGAPHARSARTLTACPTMRRTTI